MQFIKVTDVVNELSVARQDDSRTEWLRLMILSKSVLRELKLKYLNDFSRVYLPIDQATMTVRLPLDFERFRTISLIEECWDQNGRCSEKVIPLTHNPYINITPVPTEPLSTCNTCNCTPTHPVCSELANYTSVCEDVMVDPNASPPLTGVKQTTLRTCANGDIIKEVTQPTQIFSQGNPQCDYAIEINVTTQSCSYVADWKSLIDPEGAVILTFVINGFTITSPSLAIPADVDAYMASLGWVVVIGLEYDYTGVDTYGAFATLTDDNGSHTLPVMGSCTDSSFPYTITTYNVDGIGHTDSPNIEIANQQDQDDFFDGLGFVKVDNTHYIKQNSANVYFTMTVQTNTQTCNYEIDIADFTFAAYPYTISYTLNGVPVTSSLITNDDTLLAFFDNLGFVSGGAGFVLNNSPDDYGTLFTQHISPPIEFPTGRVCSGGEETSVINFTQSNCIRPLINEGVSSSTTRDVLCNIPVHEGCSCIIETPETIATICDCCSSLLNCCQNGALTGWNGWGYVPSCLTNSPQPYNVKGTYSLDEVNGIIYLDSVCASKVLLAYDTDGSCDGMFMFPDYLLDAFKAGLAWYHIQYNEDANPRRRLELKMNYQEELTKLSRTYTDPIRMSDLVSALRTLKTPY